MPDEELLRRAADRLTSFERTGKFGRLLSRQARTDAYRLIAEAAPAPDQVVLFEPVMLAMATFWYRARAGDLHPEAEQDARTALNLRNILRHLLPDPSVLPEIPPELPQKDLDPLTLRAVFATTVGGVCLALSEEAYGSQTRLRQGIAWLHDAVSGLPADHAGFPDAAALLIMLHFRRYGLAGDRDSLAAAGETAATVCRTVSPDHLTQGTSLPLILRVLTEAAAVLGRPSPHEVLRIARESGVTRDPETARHYRDPDQSRRMASALASAVKRCFQLLRTAPGSPDGGTELLLDQILLFGTMLAVSKGLPGLPAEIHAAIAFADCLKVPRNIPPDRVVKRIGRWRLALEGLPADHPARSSYAVLVAASVLQHAGSLPDPGLESWAQALASGLEDSEPVRWLRAGSFEAAWTGAICALPQTWSPESARVLEKCGSRSLRLAAGALTTVTGKLRASLGEDLRLVCALADAEAPLGSPSTPANRDLDSLTQRASLLRQVYDATGAPAIAQRLAGVLGMLGTLTADPGLLIEASALESDTSNRDTSQAKPGTSRAADEFRSAWQRVIQAQYSYMFTFDPDELERAKAGIPALYEAAERADAERGGESTEYRDRVTILRDEFDLVNRGPQGVPTDVTDEMIGRLRATYEAMPTGSQREPALLNLLLALHGRAAAVRSADPDRAGQLLAEASELTSGMTSGIGVMMNGLAQRMLAVHSGDWPPPADADPQAGPPTEFTLPLDLENTVGRIPMLKAMLTHVQEAVSGGTSPQEELKRSVEMLRDPALPAWFRVQLGFTAASEAAQFAPNGLDWSLGLCAETLMLVERLTDRGSSEAAAENALIAFDGTIRRIAGLMCINALSSNMGSPAETVEQGVNKLKGLVSLIGQADGDPDADIGAAILEQLSSMNAALRSTRMVSSPMVGAIAALHERGRGLLLARRLESRVDLASLRIGHPELAARFEELTARLEAGSAASGGRARLDGRRTSEELDTLIGQIRQQPGFGEFLAWLSPDDLRELASQGPIVVLNHAEGMTCWAFIVTPEEITALHLNVTAEDVADAGRRLSRAVEMIYARGGKRPGPAELLAARDDFTRTLAWTWHKVVWPVLESLGYLEPAQRERRLWWMPTGPFNALPLQAAQCTSADCGQDHSDQDPGGSALDCVISSFIPGFQTLSYARARLARSADGGERRALVVSESEDELPGAEAAARFTAGVLGDSRLSIGIGATRASVLSALGKSPWVQFGCHAQSSLDRPAGSWIQLPSGETLTVQDICRVRPDLARLAVLTACGTARTPEHLSDEAVHITSAFLLAGYPEAVGTLWEVESTQIERFLRGFYPRALDGTHGAAQAVHHAVRAIRDKLPARPYIWAAYIHAGG